MPHPALFLLPMVLLVGCLGPAGLFRKAECAEEVDVDTGPEWRARMQTLVEEGARLYLLAAPAPTLACAKQQVEYVAGAVVLAPKPGTDCPASSPVFHVTEEHGSASRKLVPAGVADGEPGRFVLEHVATFGLAQHALPPELSVALGIGFPIAEPAGCHAYRLGEMRVAYTYLAASSADAG